MVLDYKELYYDGRKIIKWLTGLRRVVEKMQLSDIEIYLKENDIVANKKRLESLRAFNESFIK
jgi:hypothetical protein